MVLLTNRCADCKVPGDPMPMSSILSLVLTVSASVSGTAEDPKTAAKQPDLLASSSESGTESFPETGAALCPAPGQDAVREAWSYAPPEEWKASFRGVADRVGNLYWAECTVQWVCDVVSAAPDGRIRFRAGIPGSQPSARFDR